MFGASIAASRAASRACASSSPRSSPRIHPIAHVTSSRELPVMCGTLNRSRTTVTPARGTASGVPGPSSPSPKLSDLNLLIRSASVTLSNSGVSASYISACESAPGTGGTDPYWPEGMMLRAVAAKSWAAAGAAVRANAAAASAAILDMRGTLSGHAGTTRHMPRTRGTASLAAAALAAGGAAQRALHARGSRRPEAPRPRRPHDALHPRRARVGQLADHRARPDALLPGAREAAPAAARRVRARPPRGHHAVATLGDRAADAPGLARLLQGRLGLGHGTRRPPGRAPRQGRRTVRRRRPHRE